MKSIAKLKSIVLVLFLMTFVFVLKAQETKAILGEGIAVAGYVDDGAYVNFTGPAVKFTSKPVSVLIGLLPSLRIKEDKSESGTKNSTLTPSLGFGLTGVYRHLALQVPLFYNPKTAAVDGKWNVGVGIGYKF